MRTRSVTKRKQTHPLGSHPKRQTQVSAGHQNESRVDATHTQRHADAHMLKYRVKDSETLHNVSVRLITGQMAVSGLSEDVGRMEVASLEDNKSSPVNRHK